MTKRTGFLPETQEIDAATRREAAITSALQSGKIAVSEADAYRKRYDADPDATVRLLSRLAPSPALAETPRPRTGLLPELPGS